MKIQTMSVVVGTTACNAKCPFCVSRQTIKHNLPTTPNLRNFKIALNLADRAGATTILFTGKGEPTLYPNLITSYLNWIRDEKFRFPFIELQTNGMQIGNEELRGDNEEVGYSFDYLKEWYDLGLTTVALSAVDISQAPNKKIYGENYPDISKTAQILIDHGFTVRLSIMMMKNYVDSPETLDNVIGFCKKNRIKQLTMRPIARVDEDNEAAKWVSEHTLTDNQLDQIIEHVNTYGNPVLHLSHGATVYDYKGQNLCLSNCLTTNETDDNMRQIIYYPDGTISFDWKYEGAVLL